MLDSDPMLQKELLRYKTFDFLIQTEKQGGFSGTNIPFYHKTIYAN